MVPTAIPFLIPAILVGSLPVLSTIIASIAKIRMMQAPSATGTARPRRFFNYPLLALISFPSLLALSILSILVDLQPPHDTTTATIFTIVLLILNITTLACWFYTMIHSARLGRRDWVINMISGIALGSPLYSIIGPTERRTAKEQTVAEPVTSGVKEDPA